MPLTGLLGYAILFAVVFVESCAFVGIFVPGQVLVVLAGFLASHGYLNPWNCLWVVSLAVVAGDSLSYYLGRLATRGYLERHPRLRRLKEKYMPAADAYFQSHGGKTIIVGRFVGLLRAFTPFAAGMAGMPYVRFLCFSVLGGVLWAGGFLTAGYLFGESWRLIERWAGGAGAVAVLILLLAVGIGWLLRMRAKGKRACADTDDSGSPSAL